MTNETNTHGTLHTIDERATKAKARAMDLAALEWSANDAVLASEAAEKLEREGCRVSKSGGYYRDEAAVYRTELRERLAKLSTDEIRVGQEVLVRYSCDDHATREVVSGIEDEEQPGRKLEAVKKDRACKSGVTFTLRSGRWAYGHQVAALQSSDELCVMRYRYLGMVGS